MPSPDAKRVTVSQLLDELLVEYELHGRRSIKGVRSHIKRVREELGEMRAVDLKAKNLTQYQIARRHAEAAGGTINRELSLLRRGVRRYLEEQKLPVPRVSALPENVREGFFSQAEVAALGRSCSASAGGRSRRAWRGRLQSQPSCARGGA